MHNWQNTGQQKALKQNSWIRYIFLYRLFKEQYILQIHSSIIFKSDFIYNTDLVF